MKVLIRDKSKNVYLAADGTWVNNFEQALDFSSSTQAIAHIAAQRLVGVELFFAFPRSEFNFTCPVDPADAPLAVFGRNS